MLVIWLGACSRDDGSADLLPLRDNTLEVQAYYAANPGFFSFKTLSDLPENLNWENGSQLPDIGSPAALKGGTEYTSLQDFPRTFRTVGPGSNGSFHSTLAEISLSVAMQHPDYINQYYPGLAREWAVSTTDKTVYIRLNPAAHWSDGEPVTADDFLFLFYFMQSEYIADPWCNNWYSNEFTNITKYDELTFSVSLPDLKPDMSSYVFDLQPVPQHFYNEFGTDFVERYQWRIAPTTGAYTIREQDVVLGRSLVLTRNPDWWAKDNKYFRNRFNVDRIQISVIRDTNSVFEAFYRGELDQFYLDLAEHWYEKLADNDPQVRNGYIHKSLFYNQRPRPKFGLWINTARPLLDNQDIRIGINYASNWDLVINSFFRGDYARMNTATMGYSVFSHPTRKARPFDVDKALEHFARAGFTQRGRDGILLNDDGQRLSFTLTTGFERLRNILTILREEAAKAGLELRIEVLDATAALLKEREKQHDISFTNTRVTVGAEMYPQFWEFFHSDNAYDQAFLEDGSINPGRHLKVQTNNLFSLADPKLDALIDAYDASSELTEMIALAHRIQERLHDHAAFVPGYIQHFYRVGHWRWVRYPEGFGHMLSGRASDLFIHWIDTGMKAETLAARRAGTSFEPQINVYDQFREQ